MFATIVRPFKFSALVALGLVLILLAIAGVARLHLPKNSGSVRVHAANKSKSPAVDGVWLGMSPDLVEQRLGPPALKATTLNSYGTIVEYGYGADLNSPRVRFLTGQGAKSIQGKSLSVSDHLFLADQPLGSLGRYIGEPTNTRVMLDPKYRVDLFSPLKLSVFTCGNHCVEFSLADAEEAFQPIYLSPSEAKQRHTRGKDWNPPKL